MFGGFMWRRWDSTKAIWLIWKQKARRQLSSTMPRAPRMLIQSEKQENCLLGSADVFTDFWLFKALNFGRYWCKRRFNLKGTSVAVEADFSCRYCNIAQVHSVCEYFSFFSRNTFHITSGPDQAGRVCRLSRGPGKFTKEVKHAREEDVRTWSTKLTDSSQ